MTLEHAAVVAAQDQLRHPGSRQLPQLTGAAPPLQLHYRLAQWGQSHEIALRQHSAGGVHRQLSAGADPICCQPLPHLLRAEEAVIPQRALHRIGKAVVQLAGIDIPQTDAGHVQRLAAGDPGGAAGAV